MLVSNRRFLQAHWVMRVKEEIHRTDDPKRLAELRRALQEMRAGYLKRLYTQRNKAGSV